MGNRIRGFDFMKLRILESVLNETLDDIKKYYPNIDDDTFMELIALDPTYTGKDSAGKYGKWLLNLYNKGKLSKADFGEVTPLLNQFKIYRNRIQNKDLNSYKTLGELAEILASVVDDDSMLTPSQKTKFLKRVKSGKIQIDKSDDYDVVLDTPNFIVYVPNTHEASMKLGKGTEWCTAHENPDWYNHYTENGGKLYIIKDKKTGERWQYSDDTKDFLNQDDEDFDISELMKQDKKLSKFFEKFLGADFYNFDGTWIYDGKPVPPPLRTSIINVEISDKFTTICDYAFYGCNNLKNVNIPKKVKLICKFAFCGCEKLTDINIPENVGGIGESAFAYCKNLTKIIIPGATTHIDKFAFSDCEKLTNVTILDGLKIMGDLAFYRCYALTNIIIPDSVMDIGMRAFQFCSNLTVYTDSVYATYYCERYDIQVKSLSAKNESYKLQIREH